MFYMMVCHTNFSVSNNEYNIYLSDITDVDQNSRFLQWYCREIKSCVPSQLGQLSWQLLLQTGREHSFSIGISLGKKEKKNDMQLNVPDIYT